MAIGKALPRFEDPRLLTGRGRYTADLKAANMLEVAFLRSDHAHGRILGFDASVARKLPGVFGVYAAADIQNFVTPLVASSATTGAIQTPNLALAQDKVRYVGEPILAVVACDRATAEDAIGEIRLSIEGLDPVTDPIGALVPDAPVLHEHAGHNLYLERSMGRGDPEPAFAGAAHVVSGRFRMTRKTPSAIECRAILSEWDAGQRQLTVQAATQMPGLMRDCLGAALSLSPSQITVIARDVGGGFGGKGYLYPDELAVCALSVMLERPLRWVSDRLEDLLTTYQAFDERVEAALALDAAGEILALRADVVSDGGAYSIYPWTAAMEPVQVISFMPGPYRVPHYSGRVRVAATCKAPMGAYRGVGRPSATFVMERLIDMAAAKIGCDPAEVRRRNMIAPDDFPYRSASGIVWARVGFTESLDLALDRFDYAATCTERDRARAEGRMVGIGIASYGELTGIGSRISVAPGVKMNTGVGNARLHMDSRGNLTARFATSSQGQGHETTLAQVVAEELCCPAAAIRVLHGNSSFGPHEVGTFASRTAVLSGGAATKAARELRGNIVAIAAHMLSLPADQLQMQDCVVTAQASNRSLSFGEIARAYYNSMTEDWIALRETYPFDISKNFDPFLGTPSAGTHVALVEIDAGTCAVNVLRYVIAEDCGRIINPLIVAGQSQGAFAQGLGAALFEELIFSQDGQALSGSFVDYVIPSATEVPAAELHHVVSPHPDNLTGFRGIGEGGTIGSPAALANAIFDAIGPRRRAPSETAVETLPLTPERIWRMIEPVSP